MKYVRHLDSYWYSELIEDLRRGFEELYYKLSLYNNTIDRERFVLQPTPVQKKKVKHPFPLAEKIEPVYQWLMGKGKRPRELDDTLDLIMGLVWQNPFVDFSENLEPEWERWQGMYTGMFYRFADIAYRLETNQTVNATDVATMLHVSTMSITKHIKNGNLEAVKSNNEWVIQASVAKKWIEDYIATNPYVYNGDSSSHWVSESTEVS